MSTSYTLLLAVLPLPPSVDRELYGRGVRKSGKQYRFLKSDVERYRDAVVAILSSYRVAAPWKVWQDAEGIALLRRKKPAQRRVAVTVWWYFQTANSDIDNRLKALLDALHAYTGIDDRYHYRLTALKFIDAAFPRVEVLLEKEIIEQKKQPGLPNPSLWTRYAALSAETVPELVVFP
jgi:Holliday junction resolvase RusA-like endonuclease